MGERGVRLLFSSLSGAFAFGLSTVTQVSLHLGHDFVVWLSRGRKQGQTPDLGVHVRCTAKGPRMYPPTQSP